MMYNLVLLSNFELQLKRIMDKETFECSQLQLKELSLHLKTADVADGVNITVVDRERVTPCEWVKCHVLCASNDTPPDVKQYIDDNIRPRCNHFSCEDCQTN